MMSEEEVARLFGMQEHRKAIKHRDEKVKVRRENERLKSRIEELEAVVRDVEEHAGDLCRAYGDYTRRNGTSVATMDLSRAYVATLDALHRAAIARAALTGSESDG